MRIFIYCSLLLLMISCQNAPLDLTAEKEKIIETLELETQYFCERDLGNWQAQWSHKPFVSKMYGGNRDFDYMDNWDAINQFVVNHIAEYPAPIPLPKTNFDYDIHLFEQTALVLFSKNVNDDKVLETRFMVKEKEKWKIARMETVY